MSDDRRVPWGAYALLLVAALSLRALVAREANAGLLLAEPVGDGWAYYVEALRLRAGGFGEGGVLWQAPGTSWGLAALFAWFEPSPLKARLFQALLGALTCVLLADLGRRLSDRRLGLWAGWLYALWGPAIFYGLRIGKPAWATALAVAALLAAVAARDCAGKPARTLLLAVLAGACAAGAWLVRESLVLWIPLTLLVLGRQVGARAALVGAGGVLCALIPLFAHNQRAGAPLLATSSNFGSNLWIGNHEGADGLYTGMLVGRGGAEYEQEDALRLAEVSQHWRGEALAFWRERPGAAAALLLRKARLGLHDTEWMDSVSYSAYLRESQWLTASGYLSHLAWLLPLAAFGAWVALRDRRGLGWTVVAPVLSVFAVHVPFFWLGRFRAPALPFLCLLACFGFTHLRRVIASGAWRAHRGALACAGVVLVLALAPIRGAQEDPLATSYNAAGMALLTARRGAQAEQAFRLALEANPRHANANFNLGSHLAETGRHDEAEPFLVASIAAEPRYRFDALLAVIDGLLATDQTDHARVELENLARSLDGSAAQLHQIGRRFRQVGEPGRARALYEEALVLDPTLAAAANDLGILAQTHGHFARAVQAYEQALAADPNLGKARVNLSSLFSTAADEGFRDGERALELARGAARAGVSAEVALDLEGMALAELGRFEEAIQAAERAVELARRADRPRYAADIAHRIELYRSQTPFRGG